jgi:hypothetical protein
MGAPVPPRVKAVRKQVNAALARGGFKAIDAGSSTTGHDYLLKIWNLLLGCPVGIAIVHEGISAATMANIYYELGMLQAYGRETLVVKVGAPALPSDFVRTEYLEAGRGFPGRLKSFIEELQERSRYYLKLAGNVEKNPLLAVDYLRRAALLNGDPRLKERARELLTASGMGDRAKTSVEGLMLEF